MEAATAATSSSSSSSSSPSLSSLSLSLVLPSASASASLLSMFSLSVSATADQNTVLTPMLSKYSAHKHLQSTVRWSALLISSRFSLSADTSFVYVSRSSQRNSSGFLPSTI
ncbi:hypothetical protein NP493_441g00029 [Ridgeia piscesae]|uniref:Uncharacterized protein n=1 Tax=Ridgeia piscesae TaxID=27915 RepID=A0AAD9NTV3_RIDPI|nr:hypothetical protein NP493_441g00029 [Ridgeia piscesae]